MADEHVYVDDGISGAEFANRPGFVRVMAALKPRPPFQALIMSEESRLGREAIETAYALKQLIQPSVRVFFYLEDRERTFDCPTDKLLMSVTAFADELERQKAALRVYDAMQRKARAGHVTGGRVFGYDNVEVPGADGKRSHVERRINPQEAAVVREIFERYAAGEGMRRIAHSLNARRVPSPRAQQRRQNGWQIGTLRTVLARPLYKGVKTWNRTKKRNAWGQKQQRAKAETEWIELPAPELRILSDVIWATAQRRRQERTVRTRTGELKGKGARIPKYLLSGLLTCSCGGRYEAIKYKARVLYVCATHRRKGPAVCGNAETIPMEAMDRAVIAALEQHSLNDRFIEQVLDTVAAPPDTARLDADVTKADQELRNLIELAKTAEQSIPQLALEIAKTNTRLVELRGQIAAIPERPDRERLRLALARRVADWRDVLRHHSEQARFVVAQLTGGRLTTLKKGGKPFWLIELEAPGLLGELAYQCGTSPEGTDRRWKVSGDTREAA